MSLTLMDRWYFDALCAEVGVALPVNYSMQTQEWEKEIIRIQVLHLCPIHTL